MALTGNSTRQQKSQSVYSQAFQYLMIFPTLRINSARLIVHNTISFSLMVHGFCPNCAIFVLLFVLAIQLFRTYNTNSQLIHCNFRTILLIADTWLAFPVILSVQRVFVANSLQPSKLVFLLYGCFYLRLATRSIRTSPIARCGYIARSLLSLPAVCLCSCPLSAVLSIAAAGGCLSLRLWVAYWYAFRGTGRLERPRLPASLLRP